MTLLVLVVVDQAQHREFTLGLNRRYHDFGVITCAEHHEFLKVIVHGKLSPSRFDPDQS